jgi:hypothetical protein
MHIHTFESVLISTPFSLTRFREISGLLPEVSTPIVAVQAGGARARAHAEVCVVAVGLAAHSGPQFVHDAAAVGGQCAHPGLAAQSVVQVQQHGDVLHSNRAERREKRAKDGKQRRE